MLKFMYHKFTITQYKLYTKSYQLKLQCIQMVLENKHAEYVDDNPTIQ